MASPHWSRELFFEFAEQHRRDLFGFVVGGNIVTASEWIDQLRLAVIRFWVVRVSGFSIVGSCDVFPFLNQMLSNFVKVLKWTHGK